MVLTTLDWTIIVAYFLVSLAIGLYYSRRASANVGEYFLSGRDLPWWLAGTSMVATTFAADTPLAVAGFVARNGIAVSTSSGRSLLFPARALPKISAMATLRNEEAA